MVLAIRLARWGQRGRPFYRIVVADKVGPRDGKHIEKLGTYDPMPIAGKKMVTLDIERIKHWLSVGAQPSEPAAKLFGKAGILPPLPVRASRPKLENGE